MGGKVQLQFRSVFAPCGQGGAERAARIDCQHVARLQEGGQFGEAAVDDPVVRAVGDEQAHVIAGAAADFGRLARLEFRRQLEVERLPRRRVPAADRLRTKQGGGHGSSYATAARAGRERAW
jgi:hypothetical protein